METKSKFSILIFIVVLGLIAGLTLFYKRPGIGDVEKKEVKREEKKEKVVEKKEVVIEKKDEIKDVSVWNEINQKIESGNPYRKQEAIDLMVSIGDEASVKEIETLTGDKTPG